MCNRLVEQSLHSQVYRLGLRRQTVAFELALPPVGNHVSTVHLTHVHKSTYSPGAFGMIIYATSIAQRIDDAKTGEMRWT